jgi:broad specificity phosphatase PhoE
MHVQTGRTDIPLTAKGEEQVKEKAEALVGEGRKLSHQF